MQHLRDAFGIPKLNVQYVYLGDTISIGEDNTWYVTDDIKVRNHHLPQSTVFFNIYHDEYYSVPTSDPERAIVVAAFAMSRGWPANHLCDGTNFTWPDTNEELIDVLTGIEQNIAL